MLRTTITKIKKICTLAFVPRIFRGDVRCSPGKFEKFSLAVIRKAAKCTKSSKDRNAECEKCKRIIEIAFGPGLPHNTLDGIKKTNIPGIDIQIMQNTQRNSLTHMVAPQTQIHETQHEKCQRLIGEAFGKEKDSERKGILKNVCDIPTENIHLQATTAKTNEEKLTQKIEIIRETPLVEAETSKVEGFNLPPKVLGNTKPNNQSYNIEKYSNHVLLQDEAITKINITGKYKQSKVDFKDDTYAEKDTRSMRESAVFEDCIVEGYPEEKSLKDFEGIQDARNKKIKEEFTQKDFALHAVTNNIDKTFSRKEDLNYQSNATKQSLNYNERPVFEDCLVEGYPETNNEKITEATKPTVEGFNIFRDIFKNGNPVQLFSKDDSTGNRKAGSSPERDIQVTLDELAKHCLNSPSNQIDERLIKEMENLGIPQTGTKNTFDSPVMDNELVQMDVLKKPRKPVKKSEIDLETREYQREPPTCNVIDKLYPSFNLPHIPKDLKSNEDIESTSLRYERIQLFNLDTKLLSFLPENSLTEKMTVTHIQPERTQQYNYETQVAHTKVLDRSTTKPKFDFNQVIIDPFDKKTIAHDTEEYNNDDSLYYSIKESEKSEEIGHISQAADENEQPESSYVPSSAKTPSFHSHWRTEPVLAVETSRLKEIPSACHDAESIYQDYEAVNQGNAKSSTEQSYPLSSVREQYSHSFIQPESMVNPLYDKRTIAQSNSCDDEIRKNVLATIGPLPKLNSNTNISLSEMLKRVRQRNHVEYCRAFESLQATEVNPIEGKCGKKTPPCPPPAPKCPPPKSCPPPSCPPPKPPCPKPCKPDCPPPPSPCPPPKKKSPCDKFKKKCSNTLGLLLDLCPQIYTCEDKSTLPIITCNFNNKGLEPTVSTSKAVLTEEVVLHLHNLGSKLILAHCYGKMEALEPQILLSAKSETIGFAKDYEPWTPIPCWPIPKKEVKRPLVCPKEGCKLIPPPRLNPPCKENPCINFPRRTYSLVDIFSFSLGKCKVFNIGDF